jgi:hypothetical protein
MDDLETKVLKHIHQASRPAMGIWHNNQPLKWFVVHAQNKMNVV